MSDWSSDVCSSDLVRTVIAVPGAGDGGRRWLPFPLQAAAEGVVGAAAEGGVVVVPVAAHRGVEGHLVRQGEGRHQVDLVLRAAADVVLAKLRNGSSEEGRVGKECVRKCRYRWWPVH